MGLSKRQTPEAQKTEYSSGTFRPDGSWRDPQPPESNGPVKDERWRFVDSLVAIRRDEHRHVPPAQFARFVMTQHPRHGAMFGGLMVATGMRVPTLELWAKLDRFEDWKEAPCPTSVSCAVRDGGWGPFAGLVGGRAVDRRELIANELPAAGEIRRAFDEWAKEFTARHGVEQPMSEKEAEARAREMQEQLSLNEPRAQWLAMSPEARAEKLEALKAKGWGIGAPLPSLPAAGLADSDSTPSTSPTLFGLPGARAEGSATFDPAQNEHGLDCLCTDCVSAPVGPVEAEPTPFV